MSVPHLPVFGRVIVRGRAIPILNKLGSSVCGSCFKRVLVEDGGLSLRDCADRYCEKVRSGRNRVYPDPPGMSSGCKNRIKSGFT